jgi:hypothetical protein
MHDFALRPAWWRLTVVAACQWLITAWGATVVVSTILTFLPALYRIAAATFFALALLVLFLWPSSPALSSRLGVSVVSTALAAFGGARAVEDDEMLFALAQIGLVLFATIAARRTLALSGNFHDVRRFVVRLALVSACAMVPMIAVAAAGVAFKLLAVVWCAAVVAGSWLMAAMPRAAMRYEQLDHVELRSTVVPLLALVATMCAITFWQGGLIRYGIPLE